MAGSSVRKRVMLIVLCALFLLLAAACDYTKYPDEVAKKWVCSEPVFVIDYSSAQTWSDTVSYLEADGTRYDVDVLYSAGGGLDVVPKGETNLDTVLLKGRWKLSGTRLILTINEDHLFHGAYSQIILSAEPTD